MSEALVYVSDSEPGIARRRCGRGFSYVAPDGTTIFRDPEPKRMEALTVPPAYDDVWNCPISNGHLQATGRNTRNPKQYRSHSSCSAARSQTKLNELAASGKVLPSIRKRVDHDLATEPEDFEFGLAVGVAIIDRISLKVGHPDYSKQNGNNGALTLRRKHLSLEGGHIRLEFLAKGGKKTRKMLTDRKLQNLLHIVNDMPGANLLTWMGEDGEPQTLSSQQLNVYLCDAANDFRVTAKTFGAWAETSAAFA